MEKKTGSPSLKTARRLFLIMAVLFAMAAGCDLPDPFYVQVAFIEGVPETGEAGTPLTLTGTIRPSFASNKNIEWSVIDAGTTGAEITGNILNTTAGGKVSIRAVIANGITEGKNYIQDFEIAIEAGLPVYTVSFVTNGGGFVPDQSVKEGRTAKRPDDPDRHGYNFVNWYDNEGLAEPPYDFNTPVTGNITLYAKWSLIVTYEVTFNTNGGNEIPGQTVNEGGKINKPTDPYKHGYKFGGWYKEDALTHPWAFELDAVNDDITLYAKWIAVYVVSFNANGGNTPASRDVEDGGCASRPADPVKAGYGFVNWYSDSGLTAVYDFNAPVTGNITLYAKWVELISDIVIYVTGPAKGETPVTAAETDGTVSYTVGAVSWSPNHNSFMGLTVYTATVTVTANTGSKFTETPTAEINGHAAVIISRTDATVTISHTFDATLPKTVTGIEIISQPAKTAYTHGDKLDLTGLSVELTYDDNTTELFTLDKFGDLISEEPAHDSTLSHTTHDNKPVIVSVGVHKVNTDNLTVNGKIIPVVVFPSASAIVYLDALSKSTLNGGDTALGSFTWADDTIVPTAAGTHNYNVVFIPYDLVNYDYSGVTDWNNAASNVVRPVSVTVNKKAGGAVGTPSGAFNSTAKTITVTAVNPPEDQSVEYAILTVNNGSPSTWQDGTSFTVSSAATYYVYARSKENSNYNAGAPNVSAGIKVGSQNVGVFGINPDESPTVTDTGLVISRTGAGGLPKTVSLTVGSGFTDIKWYYNNDLLGSSATLVLDSSNPVYNMIGKKFVRVEAWKDGVPYITNIEFEVKP